MNAEVTGTWEGEGLRGRKDATQGFSLIELMIALTVLAIGMAGMALLFTTAAMGNSRAKGDTAGTMLAQTVLEKITAQPANNPNPVTLLDCNPNGATTWSITSAPGGAPLDNNGSVDFTQAAVPNYAMQFVSCGSGGRQVIYDVRWNVRTVSANTRIITVSARPAAMAGNGNANQALLFAPPITLRTVGGI
jgi:prepilin-type N-terminal cleavage/methylation domain-containing protein